MGNYVEKNLRPNERLIAKAQISWIPVIPTAVYALIIIIIGAVAKHPVWGILIGLVLVGLRVLGIMSVELGVTDKKIIGKTGVIMANSLDTYLEKIDNFSINESLAGKIFGYATIQICTTSSRLRFACVKDAMAFKNLVMDCIDQKEANKMGLQAQMIGGAAAGAPQMNAPAAPVGGNVCRACGNANKPSSRFCEKCGQPLQ
ncbi:MAG: PH domain-containing protein [Ruminococcus sp.]|nr:PH domain-containing protein [Ruminococcus sp.]